MSSVKNYRTFTAARHNPRRNLPLTSGNPPYPDWFLLQLIFLKHSHSEIASVPSFPSQNFGVSILASQNILEGAYIRDVVLPLHLVSPRIFFLLRHALSTSLHLSVNDRLLTTSSNSVSTACL